MVDLTDWGPRQAIQHLVNDLEPYSVKQRDEQIDGSSILTGQPELGLVRRA